MHIHLSCARSPIAVPHCLLRACAGRPGLSPSTTPGLRKALDFGELTSDPLIRGIQQKYIKNLVDFDALLKEAKSKGELAQMIQETFVHDRSVLNPPERDRTYSSTKDNDAPGTGSSRSMLNSPQAWSAETAEQATEWMQIYAGGATAVFGVRNQPRVQYDEKVKAFTVQYSADDFMWSDVDGGAIFTSTSGNFDALFAMPVTAQYIRITVQGFVKWPSMRAGLLVHLTTEEKEAKDAEAWTEALNKMLPPPMDWKWPTAHGVDCKDYHPRIGGGKEVVGGYTRGYYLLANVWWWCGKEVGRGTMLSAVALSLLWLLLGGVLQQPTLTYSLSVLLTTAALCALTYAFWVGGETEVGGGYEQSKYYYQLANACDSSGAGHPFHTEKGYGVNGADYVDFIFTFEDANTWCSGYRQFGSNVELTPSFTKDIEICTSDENFGPWTPVATGSHSTWQNGQTNTFTDDGTTTEWTPKAPSKYLRVRTLTNHGSTDSGGRLTVRFLQLKFSARSN